MSKSKYMWEYKIVCSASYIESSKLEKVLNKFGDEGFECVGMLNEYWLLLKRKK